MSHFFFGYGSLVNTATHDYRNATPATLQGWRRHWCGTAERGTGFLTAVRDPSASIMGLTAEVSDAEWQALDDREFAYLREDVSGAVSPAPAAFSSLITYAVPEENQIAGPSRPICLSYIDVVVQGYLQVFGRDGGDHFFATTSGWDVPIVNDRAAPAYPRHQRLTTDETAYVDAKLAALSAQVQQPV